MRYEKESDAENFLQLIKSSTYDETGYKNVLECKPHFHEAKEFLFVSEGEQYVICNGETVVLEAGDIYFVDRFSPHFYAPSEAEGYVLLLRGVYFEQFEKEWKNKTLPSVLTNKEANIELFQCVEEWYNRGLNNKLRNISYAYRLISHIVDEYGVVDVSVKNQDTIIKNMLRYVEENYMDDIDLSTMAKQVNCSAVYCSKIWNIYIKENFRDYVNRRRVWQINAILQSEKNNRTVLEIAMDCGFNSQSTFYRAYKKVYGTTPKQTQ